MEAATKARAKRAAAMYPEGGRRQTKVLALPRDQGELLNGIDQYGADRSRSVHDEWFVALRDGGIPSSCLHIRMSW